MVPKVLGALGKCIHCLYVKLKLCIPSFVLVFELPYVVENKLNNSNIIPGLVLMCV